MTTQKPKLHVVPPPANGRVPPNDLDAEGALLGAIMLTGGLDRVADRLSAEHFYADANGKIYATARELWAEGKPVDLVTVAGILRDRGLLERVGGAGYLATLVDCTPAVEHLESYADRVVEKARVRQLIATCQRLAAEGYGDVGDCQAWLDSAEQAVYDVARVANANSLTLAGTALGEALAKVSAAMAEGRKIVGAHTGFDRLDAMLAGLRAGSLHVLAGRPGMGKSALAANVAVNVAHSGLGLDKSDRPRPAGVAFFSLEMTKDELVERMVCSEARTSVERFRQGDIDGDMAKLDEASSFIRNLPLWLDDKSSLKPIELRAKVRRIAAESERMGYPLRLVVVDYVHLMDGSDLVRDGGNLNQEIGEITGALKQLAKDMGIAVLALSQLSREVEKRADKRPQLSDLRESGNLEQDADAVWFVYRDEYYKPETAANGIAEIIIAKHRQGRTGKVLLRWSGYCTRFDTLASADYPEIEDE